MNKSEGKHKYIIQLNNLFKRRSSKPEAPTSNDVEEGKTSQDDEDNAPPSESTVIVEDEPQKKVRHKLRTHTHMSFRSCDHFVQNLLSILGKMSQS